MNKERLLQLRRVLDEAPEDQLHMRSWSETAECGSAYCLAGFMAIDQWFRSETEIGDYFCAHKSIPGRGFMVRCQTCAPFYNLAKLFGIGIVDSERLFGLGIRFDFGPHCVTKAEVRANIDRILAGEPAETYAAILAKRYTALFTGLPI